MSQPVSGMASMSRYSSRVTGMCGARCQFGIDTGNAGGRCVARQTRRSSTSRKAVTPAHLCQE